jgi:hypothetical protein
MVAVSLTVGWMGSSLTQNSAPAQAPSERTLRPLGGQPVGPPQAEVLRQRLNEPPMPSRGRNPFVYSTRAPRPSAYRDRERQPEAAPAPVMAPPMPIAAPLPVFRLSGVASTVEDGVAVLTAILNDNGAMVFAKAGAQTLARLHGGPCRRNVGDAIGCRRRHPDDSFAVEAGL